MSNACDIDVKPQILLQEVCQWQPIQPDNTRHMTIELKIEICKQGTAGNSGLNRQLENSSHVACTTPYPRYVQSVVVAANKPKPILTEMCRRRTT